jgi:NDP-sugar pyrophosphorylase family protein
MQAVILCAGKGTRMRPLTDEKPKQMVLCCGEPLIHHLVRLLPESIHEVILVLGYKGHMLETYCGSHFEGRRMHYVWQTEQLGTAHALLQARHLLKDSFLVLYGDDIVDAESVARALTHPACLLVCEHPDPRAFGVVLLKKDGTLDHIIEKPEVPPSSLVSASGLVLNEKIFDYYYGEWKEGKEQCIPDALERYAQDFPVFIERLAVWYPINSPEQLADAERRFCKKDGENLHGDLH